MFTEVLKRYQGVRVELQTGQETVEVGNIVKYKARWRTSSETSRRDRKK